MRTYAIGLAFLACLSLAGCTKEEVVLSSGSLVGFVDLTDNYGEKMEDRSGITVSLEGTALSSVTNADGRFALEGVPAGTYNMRYESEEFATYRSFSIQFVGGNLPAFQGIQRLFQLPWLQVENLSVTGSDTRIFVDMTFAEPPGYNDVLFFILPDYRVRYYMSLSSDVSQNNFEYESGLGVFNSQELSFHTGYYYPGQTTYGSGSTVYVAVYMENPYDEFGYYDYESEMRVYSTRKKIGETVQVVLP